MAASNCVVAGQHFDVPNGRHLDTIGVDGSSVCWLANNILSRSIGGTALKTVLIVPNCATITRILLTERKKETISPADSALISES